MSLFLFSPSLVCHLIIFYIILSFFSCTVSVIYFVSGECDPKKFLLQFAQVLITVPLRALMDQFALDFPGFCKVGTGHNKNINFDAKGFIAVTDSVHLLKHLKFDAIFVDEGHHPLPPKMPQPNELFLLSATHKVEPDFRYTMGQAIEDGVLCDYDITVPALTAHHQYVCLADLLLKQLGRFRRVLAYCNTVAEAKRFRMVLKELGLAAWHINGKTPFKKRAAVMEEFAGPLVKPVHVLVTVEVLGEGINIPNADTCMFVEPRNSYRSIIQAIGRVLRNHPSKTLAHIVLPAVAIASSKSNSIIEGRSSTAQRLQEQQHVREPETQSQTTKGDSIEDSIAQVRQCLTRAPDSFSTFEKPPASMAVASSARSVRETEVSDVHLGARTQGVQNRKQQKKHSEPPPAKLPNRDFEPDQVMSRHGGETLIERRREIVQPADWPTNNGLMGSAQGQTAIETHSTESQSRPKLGAFASTTPAQQSVGSHELQAPPSDIDMQYENFQAPSMPMTPGTDGRRKCHGTFKLKAFGGSPLFDQQYGSQVERFLATLMLADHRLVSAAVGHRIVVADCTLETVGGSMMEGLMAEIYSRLSAILSREDRWEVRLRSLEAFVNTHGKLPSSKSASKHCLASINCQRTGFKNCWHLHLWSINALKVGRRMAGGVSGRSAAGSNSTWHCTRACQRVQIRIPESRNSQSSCHMRRQGTCF